MTDPDYAWPPVDLTGACFGCGGSPTCWVCHPPADAEEGK